MPSTFSDFTLGTTPPPSDDFLVGYDLAELGGERRWTVSTIAKAVSSLMTSELNNKFASKNETGVATGIVAYFARSTAPTGWIECNGAAITTALGASYTDLRNFLIAASSPFGNTSGNPLVPNIRGIFIRGNLNQTIGGIAYSGGNVGTTQNDQFQGHWHDGGSGAGYGSTAVSTWTNPVAGGGATTRVNGWAPKTGTDASGNSYGNVRTGTETRPANISLLPCIKL